MNFSVGGIFKVWKGLPGQLKFFGEFHNHVTDYGMNILASKALKDAITKVHVGSGSTAPTNSDTALESEVASTTTTTINTQVNSSGGGYVGWKRKFSFSAGAAEGTLTELGLSDGTSLFNRQLFTDYAGNITSIVVGASDVLEILCEVRIYGPSTGYNKSSNDNFTINSESYTNNFGAYSYWYSGHRDDGYIPYRPFNYLNSTSWWSLGASTNNYSSGYSGTSFPLCLPDSVSMNTYVEDSFQLNFTLTWNAGTYTSGNVNLLVGYKYSVYPNTWKTFFELGIGSPYNQYQETAWTASTAYLENEYLISALGDSYIYKVITAGTSHTSAPTWPTTIGGTVTDGNGVEYECVAPLLRVESSESLTLNVRISWSRET